MFLYKIILKNRIIALIYMDAHWYDQVAVYTNMDEKLVKRSYHINGMTEAVFTEKQHRHSLNRDRSECICPTILKALRYRWM